MFISLKLKVGISKSTYIQYFPPGVQCESELHVGLNGLLLAGLDGLDPDLGLGVAKSLSRGRSLALGGVISLSWGEACRSVLFLANIETTQLHLSYY